MNSEIKEIIESLDKIAKAEYYPEDLLTYKECQLLLNYTTNLQKENEYLKKQNTKLYKKDTKIINELKEELEITQEKWNKDKQWSECRTKEWLDYKQRIDKAIEYIKEWRESDGSKGYCTFDLLEILGGDEE